MLEGEEEVTTDEMMSMSGLLEEYSRLFHIAYNFGDQREGRTSDL